MSVWSKTNQPWNLLKDEGMGKRKNSEIVSGSNFLEKTLCPCLFTWMLFLHPKKACQETCHLSGACDSRLSAHCLATRTASGYPGVTYTATSHCLVLTALNRLHLLLCYIRVLAWETLSCLSVSAGPMSSGNGISRKNNIRLYLGIRFTKPPKSQ